TSGGGAGGTIRISAAQLAGAGTLKAGGGPGGQGLQWSPGGGGAGGRISVVSQSADASTLSYDVSGGTAWSDTAQHGGAGTVYIRKPGQASYDLLLGAGGAAAAGPRALTPVANPLSVDRLALANAAVSGGALDAATGFDASGIWSLTASALTFP